MIKFKEDIILKMQRMGLQWCEHSVTVRRIGKGWNVRVFVNGILNQESRVYSREHIRLAIAEMLRWEDKSSNFSDMAIASRARNFQRELND